MSARRGRAAARRLETWVWTGPFGHLVGGGLDLGEVFARYGLARARNAIAPALARRRRR
ncbi:MAG TPA: hypothetical protein VGX51_00415 [Solirubrobacteraceae bacterium]|nr:hypothetical protein [Solirubrobacteraceae bacterium]